MKQLNSNTVTKTITLYRRDTSGQFAVLFALLAFPILIALAYVSDMTYAGKVKEELKGSLDAAALAAVINQNLSESERAAFAKGHFDENFEFSDMFEIDIVNASAKKVELSASGGFPSYIGAMTGRDKFALSASAASILTTEDVICVLTLDESGAESFKLSGGASLYGRNCSVQVNSRHTRAAVVDPGAKASAKSFCVAGGATGSYIPFVNSECARVEDPYKDLPAPPLQNCLLTNLLGNLGVGGGGGGGGLGGLLSVAEEALGGEGGGLGGGVLNLLNITDNMVLEPGTYCHPVIISGENVQLRPGTYVFQDSLVIMDQSEVWGDEVTLAFNGQTSQIAIMGGSQVRLTAPKALSATGEQNLYAGLAIFQNSQGGKNGIESFLRGSSGMNITGTVYLPNQRLYVGQDSNTNTVNSSISQSPATSFIAYQVHLENSETTVAVNHKVAGLPPMLPRSDEGARLVK